MNIEQRTKMTEEKKICVTIYLPVTLAAKFRKHAMAQCGNISFWVKSAIDEKMKKEAKKCSK